ncbi:MAG TPA: PDZ domain-containing protein [Candidatus Polarisedimenticolaceae bacterium]|nr:PDZ domain-containing protein [Candidatus Polarisedimenticolaceae bacterium]
MILSVFSAVWLLAAAPTPEPPAPPPAPQPVVWMGVFLDDAADGGVQVLGLVPGGPADRSGMEAGDVVLGVGSVSVLDLETLNQTLLTMKPGQRAELRVLRDGTVQTVPLVLGDRAKVKPMTEPTPTPAPAPRPLTLSRRFRDVLGLEVVSIPEDLRKHYGAPAEAGALVVKLEADGPAARAGLRVGDVLVRAGERPVQGPADVLAGVISASDDEVPLQVIRSRKAVMVSVPRPAVPRPGRAGMAGADARVVELTAEVDRLRARVAELEAELEKARRE